jgi:hypothetical protein
MWPAPRCRKELALGREAAETSGMPGRVAGQLPRQARRLLIARSAAFI